MNSPDSDTSSNLFRNGVSIVHNVIDKNTIEHCHRAIQQEKSDLFEKTKETDRFYVSSGRFYKAICIEGPVANRELLLPKAIESALVESLGTDFVFDSFGIINSLPGAAEQHWHRDGGILFPGNPLNFLLPVTAVTLAIPLVEMNDETGTTGFALGSHRANDHPLRPDFEPVVPVGSAAIWDYRIFHKGMANRSRIPRPLFYATYCRPWWRDVSNFDGGRGVKLSVRRETFDGLDEIMQSRLARAVLCN